MTHVLIVEDDKDLREALAAALSDEGYTCETSADGAKALERLRTGGPPKLVILDLMMPVMDGWTLRQALLSDAKLKSLPVLVLSAARPPHVNDLEPARYMRKPVELDDLLEYVVAIIGKP